VPDGLLQPLKELASRDSEASCTLMGRGHTTALNFAKLATTAMSEVPVRTLTRGNRQVITQGKSVEFFLLHNVFTRLDWQRETVVDKRISKLWACSSQQQ